MKQKLKKLTKKQLALNSFKTVYGSSFEYFDDRFYKIYIPKKNDDDDAERRLILLSGFDNVPDEYKTETDKEYIIYLPSVTTIMNRIINQSYLATWRGDVGNKRADEIIDAALNKGSNIHRAINKLSVGYDIIYQNLKTENITNKQIAAYKKESGKQVCVINSQDEMIQISRFQKLINTLGAEIIDAEATVYSLSGCYAGTLDVVFRIKEGEYYINTDKNPTYFKDGYYLGDYKTGKSFDDTTCATQLTAYYDAHHLKNEIAGVIGIHLNSSNKGGINGVKIYLRFADELNPFRERFRAMRELFYSDKYIIPSELEVPTIISLTKNSTN